LDPGIAVQGNLDPAILTTSPELTRREAEALLAEAAGEPGYIFNLGHGMLPSAKIECVEALTNVVTQWNHG
jgi:uroporphyrinogen decarboxylase